MNHRVFDRIDAVVGEHVWNFADFATAAPEIMRADGTRRVSSPGTAAQGRRVRAAPALAQTRLISSAARTSTRCTMGFYRFGRTTPPEGDDMTIPAATRNRPVR